MDPKIVLSILLAAGFLGYAAWVIYIAYPVFLEKQVQKGRSWVYLPLHWKSARKFWTKIFSRIFFLANWLLGAYCFNTLLHKENKFWILVSLGVSFILIYALHRLLMTYRYQQQEDSYYFIHDELSGKMENEGKQITKTASQNLASYRLQSLLRTADLENRFLATLNAQAKLSRTKKQPTQNKALSEAST